MSKLRVSYAALGIYSNQNFHTTEFDSQLVGTFEITEQAHDDLQYFHIRKWKRRQTAEKTPIFMLVHNLLTLLSNVIQQFIIAWQCQLSTKHPNTAMAYN